MAKTPAQRQAAYRARRPYAGKNGNGERRLNLWIDTSSSLALDRLVRRYGVTKREFLEKMILEADEAILRTLDLDTPEWDRYFGITP